MAEYVLDDPRITPRELTGFARDALELTPDNQFILERWFPNMNFPSTKWEADRGTDQDFTASAPRRAYDAPLSVSGRPGSSRRSGDLPPLGDSKILLESEIKAIQEGKVTDANLGVIFNDVTSLVLGARNTGEIDRADVIDDGKITYEGENGLFMEADFKRKASRTATVASLFSAGTGVDAIGQETSFVRTYRDEEGAYPMYALCGPEVVDDLRTNVGYREASRDVRAPSELSLDEINEVRRRRELPEIIEYRAKVRGRDGSVGPVLDPTKMHYLPAGPVGVTQWGRPVLANERELMLELDNGGYIVFIEKHKGVPLRYQTVLDGIMLPTMNAPDKTAVLTVRSSS